MAENKGEAAGGRGGATLYGAYLGSVAAALAGNLAVRLGARGSWLPPAGQVVLAVVSALPLAAAGVAFWWLLRRDLDEMLQRIVLEGLAFAFVVHIPLAALYVNLATAGARTPRLEAADVLLLPMVLVAIGIATAWRRYR